MNMPCKVIKVIEERARISAKAQILRQACLDSYTKAGFPMPDMHFREWGDEPPKTQDAWIAVAYKAEELTK